VRTLIGTLALGALAVLAVPAAAEPRPITLDEAVRMAQQNALIVIQAQGQSRTASAGVRSAYGSFLPSVSVSAGASRQLQAGQRTRIDSNGNQVTVPTEPWSYTAGLGASVDLFDGGRRFFDLRQAKAREDVADVNETAQRYNAALAAKQQFFNVLAARESQAAAAAQLEQAQQQRRVAVARARAREATRSDSLRAEIQVRNGELAVADALNSLDVADAALTRAVGADQPVTASPDASLEPAPLGMDEAALRALIVNGPDVKGAEASLTAARAAARGVWTDYLPSLGLSYSRSGSGVSESFQVANDLSYSGSMRLSLSLPLFDQFRREEQVTQAQVARDNAQAALRDARLGAEQNVVQWLGTYHNAEQRVAAQVATVSAAQEDLRLQQQRYSVGNGTLLDVLTSQTQLDQARRDLIRARLDQRVAKAQLEALAGREL
jgi:outer membrane protein